MAQFTKKGRKNLIELLLLVSETVITKIQSVVDHSINALFPDENRDIRTTLEKKISISNFYVFTNFSPRTSPYPSQPTLLSTGYILNITM